MFYIEKDNKIVVCEPTREQIEIYLTYAPQYKDLEIKETDKNLVIFEDRFYFEDDEEYKEKKKQAEQARIDNLTLTPSDVERALFKAKGWDFDDLKAYIQEYAPEIPLKAIGIELRANLFYRGATLPDGTRLIDTIGALLGYSSDDMTYLFEHKELPENVEEDMAEV